MIPEASVVSLWSDDAPRRFIGSGVLVAGRMMITAAHNLRAEGELRARIELDEVGGPGTIVVDANAFEFAERASTVSDGAPDLDLALVHLNESATVERAPLSFADVPNGEEVTIVGWDPNVAAAKPKRGSRPKVSVQGADPRKGARALPERVPRGFSGGGVFLASGILLGIVIQRHEEEELALFIPLEEVSGWLQRRLPPALPHIASLAAKLASHVDRETYPFRHLKKAFAEDRRSAKVCVCEYLADADSDNQFAQAAAERLALKAPGVPGSELWTLLDNGNSALVDQVAISLTEPMLRSTDEFEHQCLAAIQRKAGGRIGSPADFGAAAGSERRSSTFARFVTSPRTKALVVRLDYEVPKRGGAWLSRWLGSKLRRQAYRRARELNERWIDVGLEDKRVLVMVCLQTKQHDEAHRCFSLGSVDAGQLQEFKQLLLELTADDQVGAVDSWHNRIATEIEFPVSFHRFKLACEALANT